MNMLFYARINNSMQRMDNVYASNAELTELSQVFEKVQDNMYKYLKVKSSQTLLDYYQNEAKYRNELEKLNEDNINDPVKLLERNIRKMSETYLDCTAETVAAKRGRNVEQYKRKYDDATKLYRYIQSSIDELNNLMFQENSSTYAVLRAVMRYLEISNSVIMIIIVAGGMLLLIQATRNMFVPLSNMAETAQLVGQGNFHVKMHDTDAQDELGTVTRAFNTMVENLDLYMARTKASMEKEQQMMERELLMETHLKEAQLKYLQSQINPHFLYNALAVISALAMREGGKQTMQAVKNLSSFYRISLNKGKQVLSIQEEVELLQSYLKIQQMRFRDSVQVEYEIAREVLTYRTIKLLLQPLVENAIHHARKEEEVLHIAVRIQKEERDVVFQVTDDGCGIEAEKLIKLRSSLRRLEEGYGLRNVANRVRLAYGEDYGVRIESQEGYGTTVSVRIPVNE